MFEIEIRLYVLIVTPYKYALVNHLKNFIESTLIIKYPANKNSSFFSIEVRDNNPHFQGPLKQENLIKQKLFVHRSDLKIFPSIGSFRSESWYFLFEI